MTQSLEGWSTKAKDAPSPHGVRLALLDTDPVFSHLREFSPTWCPLLWRTLLEERGYTWDIVLALQAVLEGVLVSIFSVSRFNLLIYTDSNSVFVTLWKKMKSNQYHITLFSENKGSKLCIYFYKLPHISYFNDCQELK